MNAKRQTVPAEHNHVQVTKVQLVNNHYYRYSIWWSTIANYQVLSVAYRELPGGTLLEPGRPKFETEGKAREVSLSPPPPVRGLGER